MVSHHEKVVNPLNYTDRLLFTIPNSLKKHKNFLLWKSTPSKNKKPLKVPYYINGTKRKGKQGSDKDRKNLASFYDAINAFDNNSGKYTGIGFAMLPDVDLVGVDLDNCLDNEGEFIDDSRYELVKHTYCEITPSGKGVRAFYQGKYPTLKNPIEVYSNKQFLTLTGEVLKASEVCPLPDSVRKKFDEMRKGQNPDGPTRFEKLSNAFKKDPIFQHLSKKGFVIRTFDDGKVWVNCPFKDHHTTGDGDGDCAYFLAHTNGYVHSQFKCLHEHCDKRTKNEFLKAIGYAEFSDVPPQLESTSFTDEPTEDPNIKSLSDFFYSTRVSQGFVDGLGKEKFLIDNLVIENHILTVIADSGGGKTSFFFNYAAGKMAKMGYEVFYFDLDSPPTDYKRMYALSVKEGFIFNIPGLSPGTSLKDFMERLKKSADRNDNLKKHVYIFDTLKKFNDMMSKKDTKDFYVLMRRLTSLGATAILLGHANKNRDDDGNMVFEGVGDVKSDSDELLFFVHKKAPMGSTLVTVDSDSNSGAKVRAIIKPFSFYITDKREIQFLKDTVPIKVEEKKATYDEVLDTAEEYLKLIKKPVAQKQLVNYVCDKTSGKIGINKARKIIVKRSDPKGGVLGMLTRFVFTVGDKNVHYYELPKKNDSPLLD